MDSSDKNCGCLCGAKFFDVKQSYSLPIRFLKKKKSSIYVACRLI